MRNWIFIIFLTSVFVSCQPEENNQVTYNIPEELPDDLEQLKKYFSDAKQGAQSLTAFAEELEEKIQELDTSEIKKISVTAIQAKKEDFKSFVEVQASVQANKSAMASSEMGGRLLEMKWQEGEYIKKGDIVGKIDMEQVDKQLAELNTRLELAIIAYERQKKLWDQNIGSEMQFLQAKNNKESLEKSIEAVSFQKTKQYIYSPTSGIIDMVMLEQGELAGPGQPIIMIMNTGSMKVVAGVPEIYLKNVKKGETVTIKFPSLDEEIKARVSQIGRTVNPANRTFEVEVNLSNKGGLYKPNLMAIMMINDETVKNAVMIPEELIRKDVTDNAYVFVVEKGDETEFAKRVNITTGLTYEGWTVIEEGLNGEELIVAKGGRELTNRQAITAKITKIEEEK